MSEISNDSFNVKMIAEIKKMQAELNELKNSKEPTKKAIKKIPKKTVKKKTIKKKTVARKPAKKTTKKKATRRK